MDEKGDIKRGDMKLRIKDAFKEDARRGIIRIDPNIINKLGFKIGNFLNLSLKKLSL